MVPGGTRFTRSERPRPALRVIDVQARPRHETLYDVLVVPPTASRREIRRIARALRRNHPDPSVLHDVCLAEQVLGRAGLRAEYDALLARLRAAKQPMPRIGVAIEGARLGPAFATRVGEAGVAAGRLFKLIFQVAVVVVVIIVIAAGLGSTSSRYDRDRYKIPELRPIELPRFDPKLFEIKPYEYQIPKLEIPKLEIPKLDPPRLDLPPFEYRAPKYPIPKPPKIDVRPPPPTPTPTPTPTP
jgi:hypothetical protein